jgi:hypothetical protein
LARFVSTTEKMYRRRVEEGGEAWCAARVDEQATERGGERVDATFKAYGMACISQDEEGEFGVCVGGSRAEFVVLNGAEIAEQQLDVEDVGAQRRELVEVEVVAL